MEIDKSSNLLETPVQYLKGVGPRRAKAFDSIQIKTLKDLIYYFPRKYLDRTTVHTIDSVTIDSQVNLIGIVKSVSLRKMRTCQFLTAKLHDDTGSINLMWFKGVDYIKDSLKDGETIAVHGKINE